MVSLRAPPDNLSMGCPTSPDDWMWSTGRVLRRPFGEACFYAGIKPILRRMRLPNSPYYSKLKSASDSPDGPTVWYCMAQKVPLKIPPHTAMKMLTHMRTRNVQSLQGILRKDGILQPADESEQAPLRFDLDSYRDLHNTYCLVWRVGKDSRSLVFLSCLSFTEGKRSQLLFVFLSDPQEPRVSCTCWINCWHGACQHQFAIECFLGMRREKRLLATADEVEVVERGQRSDDEVGAACRAFLLLG